jgi:hypothetical protein
VERGPVTLDFVMVSSICGAGQIRLGAGLRVTIGAVI